MILVCFFFNDTATTDIYTYLHTLSLHDALPIYAEQLGIGGDRLAQRHAARDDLAREGSIDRDAIERAAAAASGRHLLLRETQRDACFCGCRAGRNQILFGRHTLVEQTLFATEIALGERQSGDRKSTRLNSSH